MHEHTFFFLVKLLKRMGWEGSSLRHVMCMDWECGESATLHSLEEGLFMHREWAKLPLWQKVSKLFSTSLCLVAENELNFWKAPVRNGGRNLHSV